MREAHKIVDTNFHSINSFGIVSGDTSKFIKLQCGLYLNSNGILAYKAADYAYREDTTMDEAPIDVYLTTIYDANVADTINGGLEEMKFVVDTSTFNILGSFYFKDKNHVYDFVPMMDGGTISVNRTTDPKAFQLLPGGFYAKDEKHCFYRGEIIKDADLKSFGVLDTSYSLRIAFDKKHYYLDENKWNPDDKKSLDSMRFSK